MSVADGSAETNLVVARRLICDAPAADLYLLPELWSSGYSRERWALIADQETPDVMGKLAGVARERKVWLCGSMIARGKDGGLANQFFLLERTGKLVGTYDKTHLFRPMREHEYLTAGVTMAIFDVEGYRVAPAICYDLRFPALFLKCAEKGVDVFLVPAQWPHPRCRPLRVLSQARAIECQCYLALSNRLGSDSGGTKFCGGSRIIDPIGTETAFETEMEGTVVTEIDRQLLLETRHALPVMQDRNPAVDSFC